MRYIAFDIHFPSDQGKKYSIGEIILSVDFFKITVRIKLANVLKCPDIIYTPIDFFEQAQHI
jgi:hypothetical protein